MGYIVYRGRDGNAKPLSGAMYTNPTAGTRKLNVRTGSGADDVVKYGFTTDVSASEYCDLRFNIDGKKVYIGRSESSSSEYTYYVTSTRASTSNWDTYQYVYSTGEYTYNAYTKQSDVTSTKQSNYTSYTSTVWGRTTSSSSLKTTVSSTNSSRSSQTASSTGNYTKTNRVSTTDGRMYGYTTEQTKTFFNTYSNSTQSRTIYNTTNYTLSTQSERVAITLITNGKEYNSYYYNHYTTRYSYYTNSTYEMYSTSSLSYKTATRESNYTVSTRQSWVTAKSTSTSYRTGTNYYTRKSTYTVTTSTYVGSTLTHNFNL